MATQTRMTVSRFLCWPSTVAEARLPSGTEVQLTKHVKSLRFIERPARGEAAGVLFLHHGRGTHEGDLIGLADLLDPQQRLHVIAPRAPLQIGGMPGFHWYRVPRVGYPEPESFFEAKALLAAFHDGVWARTGVGPEKTVLGGFSMGAVMSYAMAFSADRPAVAGVMALSGFIPTLDEWEPEFAGRNSTRVFIAHGRLDPIIGVDFAQAAHERIASAGLEVEYHESDAGHSIEPDDVIPIKDWLRAVTAD